MIIISALDNSGQLYASDLVKKLRYYFPQEEFVGIGGDELAAAGCRLVHNISDNSAMLTGVIQALRWAIPAYRRLVRIMDSADVKVLILIDSPTFNLPLARAARKRGIKTLYYIAPQTWAWARFRTGKIKRRVDKLAVILPFEKDFFKSYGIEVEFVGHPFIERLVTYDIDSGFSYNIRKILDPPRIVLMPGSRKGVIRQLLSLQLEVARLIKERYESASISIASWPASADVVRQILEASNIPYTEALKENNTGSIRLFTDNRSELIEAADLVLCASGTSTLELAYRKKPFVVMYNASKWGYNLLGRWLIHTKYLSLINILAGEELIPEFMPYIKDINEVASAAIRLLEDRAYAEDMVQRAYGIVEGLYLPGTAERVAGLVCDLIRKD